MARRLLTASSLFLFAVAVVVPPVSSVALAQEPAAAAPPTTAQTCIAIVLPSVKGVDGDATAFGNSLRELFMSYLTGPTLKAIALDARLASQAVEEARQKECGHLLLTAVTRKRDEGSRFGKAMGQAAGAAAWHAVPYGGGAAGAAARGAAVAGAYAVSNMAQTTKAKDEVTLEYRVGTADTAVAATPKSEKAKARSDGEDLLTPLVEKVAESIAATVSRK
jgi:uncharacterized protein YcfJ